MSPQVMVVVKYLFQFGFFPWNGYAMLVRNEGKPFFPPRILGLEKTDRYIKYDLVQLLVLFFHRSLLLVSPGAPVSGRALAALGAPHGPNGVLEGVHGAGGGSSHPDPRPPQCYGLWDHKEDPFAKKKPEAERAEEEEEEEERREEAGPPAVGKEGTAPPAEPGAPGAATGPEGDAGGLEEGAGDAATQLRFRRKRKRSKETKAALEEGERHVPSLRFRGC